MGQTGPLQGLLGRQRLDWFRSDTFKKAGSDLRVSGSMVDSWFYV